MRKYENYSEEEIYELMDELNVELKIRNITKDEARIKQLNFNGITVKDIIIYHGNIEGLEESDKYYSYNFSFFVLKDGTEYDFYYGNKNGDFPDGIINDDLSQFIPRGFAEASENVYEFHGTKEEAFECLNRHGITQFKPYE